MRLLRRIYTTLILGTALQTFGTRAYSFGHGTLDLHGKACASFQSMLISETAPLKQNGTLKFVSPCAYMTVVHLWLHALFAGC